MESVLCQNCSRNVYINPLEGFGFCENCGKKIYLTKAGSVRCVKHFRNGDTNKINGMEIFGWKIVGSPEVKGDYADYTFERPATIDQNVGLKELERNYNEISNNLVIVPKFNVIKFVLLLICLIIPGILYKNNYAKDKAMADKKQLEKDERLKKIEKDASNLLVEIRD